MDWKQPITTMLRSFLGHVVIAIERDWRKKRREQQDKDSKNKNNIDIKDWQSKLPSEIRTPIKNILDKVRDSELTRNEQADLIENLHGLVPEYPRYHWRGLHPEIQDSSKEYYAKEDYYYAFLEGVKRYITNTRKKSGCKQSRDQGMMGEVFGVDRKDDKKKLKVTKKYNKSDETLFSEDTLTSIEEGQKYLSMGIVTGCRNPVAHSEIKDLRDTGLFNEKDCLDALGLLSHLQRRLDDSELD